MSGYFNMVQQFHQEGTLGFRFEDFLENCPLGEDASIWGSLKNFRYEEVQQSELTQAEQHNIDTWRVKVQAANQNAFAKEPDQPTLQDLKVKILCVLRRHYVMQNPIPEFRADDIRRITSEDFMARFRQEMQGLGLAERWNARGLAQGIDISADLETVLNELVPKRETFILADRPEDYPRPGATMLRHFFFIDGAQSRIVMLDYHKIGH